MDYFSHENLRKITIDDLITTQKYLEFSDKTTDITYIKTETLLSWDSHPITVGNSVKKYPIHDYTDKLVVGHSDISVTDFMIHTFKLAHPGIKKVYSLNNLSPNAVGLPLGLTNQTNESESHKIYGNSELLIKIMNERAASDKYLFYANINHSTYPIERIPFMRYFMSKAGEGWIRFGENVQTLEGREAFLRDIHRSMFVACVRGNGYDTHRLWESLYLGAIPIVCLNQFEANVYKDCMDLPIVIIDDWKTITPEFLMQKYLEIQYKKWNLDKLKIGYWLNVISEKE